MVLDAIAHPFSGKDLISQRVTIDDLPDDDLTYPFHIKALRLPTGA